MISVESSAGAVLFLRRDDTLYFLLLKYSAGHWGLVKGHIEEGETLKETIIREVREETGISDLKFISGFKEKIGYFLNSKKGEKIFKTNEFFLAETQKEEINLSFEHTSFIWLSYHKTLDRITFKRTKEVLVKAMNFLESKGLS